MVDGLKGFPDAITAVFPRTIVQTCIVHLIRHSLRFVSWQDRKQLMPALRAIYQAETAEVAELRGAPVFAENTTSHGRLPLPADHPHYRGVLPLWSPDIRAALNDFDVLFAGHGPVFTKQEFLKHRAKVAGIRERLRQLNRQGKSQEEITQALVKEFNYGAGFEAGQIAPMMLELK